MLRRAPFQEESANKPESNLAMNRKNLVPVERRIRLANARQAESGLGVFTTNFKSFHQWRSGNAIKDTVPRKKVVHGAEHLLKAR